MTKTNFVLDAIYAARLRQHAIKAEQDSLLEANKIVFEDLKQNISGEAFAKQVKADLETDLSKIREIKANITAYEGTLPFGLRFNKMEVILDNVLQHFGEDEAEIMKITEGKFPYKYAHHLESLPVIEGSGVTTFTSAALWSTYFTLTKTNINNIDIYTAATSHAISDIAENFIWPENFRYTYTYHKEDQTTKEVKKLAALGIVHSGYSFGGPRFQEDLYPTEKWIAPQDCSSFVSQLTGFNFDSTADMLCLYRTKIQEGYIPPKQSADVTTNLEFVEAVAPEKVEPGDIYVARNFDPTKAASATSLGVGGHTTIVINTTAQEMVTIGANRDLENNKEGVIIQNFPKVPPVNHELCCLALSKEGLKKLKLNLDILKGQLLNSATIGSIENAISICDTQINKLPTLPYMNVVASLKR